MGDVQETLDGRNQVAGRGSPKIQYSSPHPPRNTRRQQNLRKICGKPVMQPSACKIECDKSESREASTFPLEGRMPEAWCAAQQNTTPEQPCARGQKAIRPGNRPAHDSGGQFFELKKVGGGAGKRACYAVPMSPAEVEQGCPPDAQTVMTKAIVLSHILLKARATPPEEVLLRFAGPGMEGERAKLADGLQKLYVQQEEKICAAGLWEHLEETEKAFMHTGAFETTMQQRIQASWLAESIMCLFWALARREQIPPYDQQVVPETNRFNPGEKATDLIANASLRPQADIDKQRNIAELWHWRCRTHSLLVTKRIPAALPNGTTMEEIIRMTAEKAAEAGILDHSAGGDFPVFGKAFREVSEVELSLLTSIAMERHKALNWLSGYAPGNRWSETPTDT